MADDADSTVAMFARSLTASSTTLRPLRRVETRWLLQIRQVTGLSYTAVFRGFHAALTVALVLLFVAALPIRTWVDVAALGGALTVLLGHQTFSGMLREAYPINHYEIVAVGCLGVVALARRPPRWLTDVVIALALAYALLLVESGVLIWVTLAALLAAGFPGVNRRTLLLSTAVLLAYGVLRVSLGITAPGIGGHGSGYLDVYYQADELERLFGASPWGFMGYNVASALSSVLLSEPRNGVFATLVAWRTGTVNPVVIIHLVSSVLATAALAWHATGWIRRRHEATESDRLLLVALAMVAVNCVFAASYIKDEIISTAGVFYAVGVFLSLRALLNRANAHGWAAAVVLAIVIATGAGLWAFRVMGLHYELRATAFTTRNDWVEVIVPNEQRRRLATSTAGNLTLRLGREALEHQTTSSRGLPGWGERYWVE